MKDVILIAYFLMWHLLVISACLFALSGLDDLFIDIYFWVRYVWRLWRRRHDTPLTYEQLIQCEEQYIAVLIPCWREAGVIGTMLRHNCYSIDYKKYYFFVGVYPNDPATVEEVQAVAEHIPNVQCVIGETPGPTNKAANLNSIYQAVKQFERSLVQPFDVFVFHDSEDVIHPLSFKLYNYLIPRKDMIQIPVFPLEVGYWKFTHWLYADEFAESHTKDIVVRESIKAHVPSAGVGTAFSRRAIATLIEKAASDMPFSTDSLTEDYRTSLALRVHKLKLVFVTQSIIRKRWKKRLWRKGYVQKSVKEHVATRAMFPLTYTKAVRQKARWIIGIVFQEWDHSKWPKDWILRYSLAHDRKSFVTHFINGFGYLIFLFWFGYAGLTMLDPSYPSLYEQFNQHPWVWQLITLVSLIMIERLIQRMIATYRVYGLWPALLSFPRAFYGNLLNLHALLRAYRLYFSAAKKQSVGAAQPAWDKTDHDFPGRHILVPYRRKLGDLLLEEGLLTPNQLEQALIRHQETGERLGRVLLELNVLSEAELMRLIARQYHLALFPHSQLEQVFLKCKPHLSKTRVNWLNQFGLAPIQVDMVNKTITIGIDDPTNELLLKKTIRYFSSFKTEFMLIDRAC